MCKQIEDGFKNPKVGEFTLSTCQCITLDYTQYVEIGGENLIKIKSRSSSRHTSNLSIYKDYNKLVSTITYKINQVSQVTTAQVFNQLKQDAFKDQTVTSKIHGQNNELLLQLSNINDNPKELQRISNDLQQASRKLFNSQISNKAGIGLTSEKYYYYYCTYRRSRTPSHTIETQKQPK